MAYQVSFILYRNIRLNYFSGYFGVLWRVGGFSPGSSSSTDGKEAVGFYLGKSTKANFQLNYHGRYAHAPHYVSDVVLGKAGFYVQVMKTVILRKEAR
jgi:hypothetical protein